MYASPTSKRGVRSVTSFDPMTIRVGNAPCSWGVLEFEQGGTRIPWEQVLDEMAASGFRGTELGDWGFLPSESGPLGQALGERDLELVAAFVPVALADPGAHAEGVARAQQVAQLLAQLAARPLVILADDNGTIPGRTEMAGRAQLSPRRGPKVAARVESAVVHNTSTGSVDSGLM